MIIKDAAGARHQILPAYAYKILKFLKKFFYKKSRSNAVNSEKNNL